VAMKYRWICIIFIFWPKSIFKRI